MSNEIPLRKFRITIGIFVLSSHFLCVAICVFFGFWYELGTEQTVSNIVAVGPIAGFYSFTFYKYIVANPLEINSEKGGKIGKASRLVQYSIVGMFCMAIVFLPVYIFLFSSIDSIPMYIGGAETVFGAYIARTFSTLFPKEVLGEI